MFGLAGTVTALIGECITLSIFERTGNRGVAGAAVFFLFFHVFCFGASYDSTSYIYGSEIFPNPVRARGLGISITGLFASTIIFLQCAPPAFASIGWKYYLPFIVMSTIMFIVIWFYFPEVRLDSHCKCCRWPSLTAATDKSNLVGRYRRSVWRRHHPRRRERRSHSPAIQRLAL